MSKKSPLGLSFEEMAAIGRRAFADAKRDAIATGLPNPYIDVEKRARAHKEIAEGGFPGDASDEEE